MSDFEFELDLSNFEANQKERYDAQGPEPEVIEAPPWDDHRSFEDLYGEDSLWKAGQLVKAGKVEDLHGDQRVWSVEGSQPYVVRIMESEGLEVPWATCDCPNGAARGGRPSCYHTAAVLSLLLGIDLTGRPKPAKSSVRG